jgi:hypothetical protein
MRVAITTESPRMRRCERSAPQLARRTVMLLDPCALCQSRGRYESDKPQHVYPPTLRPYVADTKQAAGPPDRSVGSVGWVRRSGRSGRSANCSLVRRTQAVSCRQAIHADVGGRSKGLHWVIRRLEAPRQPPQQRAFIGRSGVPRQTSGAAPRKSKLAQEVRAPACRRGPASSQPRRTGLHQCRATSLPPLQAFLGHTRSHSRSAHRDAGRPALA